MKYTIDAKGKKLGRVASEAASLLIGKRLVTMTKNAAPEVSVTIENASKLDINQGKAGKTIFKHHSGYRGGLKSITMPEFIEKKGYKELMRKTVYGMLPTNKLRTKMIKNLIVNE